jgi:hypothetical protein
MTTADPPAPEEEFDPAMARGGIAVPASLRPGTLAGYRELRRLAELLHTARPAESEPAAVYRIRTELP